MPQYKGYKVDDWSIEIKDTWLVMKQGRSMLAFNFDLQTDPEGYMRQNSQLLAFLKVTD